MCSKLGTVYYVVLEHCLWSNQDTVLFWKSKATASGENSRKDLSVFSELEKRRRCHCLATEKMRARVCLIYF